MDMTTKEHSPMAIDFRKILAHVEIFKGLSPSELDLISGLCEHHKYRNGDVIFTEHSKGKDIYVIIKGRVCIELGIKGKTDFATIQRLGDSELFGELALVSSGPRSATARCETDCETIIISREALFDLFTSNNRIGYVVMTNLASLLATRLRKTNLQLLACFLWE